MDRIAAHAAHITGSHDATMVFGHGLGGNQGQWDPIAAHFAEQFRVVTFDLAGCGASDPAIWSPVRHQSILGYADDLAALCAELDIRGAHYVGHSMAGMAGLLAAAADPGLFDSLVLVCASARYIDEPESGYLGGFSADEVNSLLEAIESDFSLWAAGFAPLAMQNADRPEFATQFAVSLAQYRPDIGLSGFRAAFTSDFRNVLPQVHTPTLVIQTPDDPAVPLAAAEYLVEHLADARLEILPAEGHFPHVVAPDKVEAAISRFLDSL